MGLVLEAVLMLAHHHPNSRTQRNSPFQVSMTLVLEAVPMLAQLCGSADASVVADAAAAIAALLEGHDDHVQVKAPAQETNTETNTHKAKETPSLSPPSEPTEA